MKTNARPGNKAACTLHEENNELLSSARLPLSKGVAQKGKAIQWEGVHHELWQHVEMASVSGLRQS